jgi:DNA-binding transcriptional regulator LsrR (DeoR family)
MDSANIQKLVEICKMYYEQGMTQEMISKTFDISRSAVSMSLTEAKNIGIIQVEIKDPSVNNDELAAQLEEKFGLRKCIVVPSGTHNENALLRVMTSQAIRFAEDLFHSHSSIGVAWGNTCYAFMQAFPENTSLCDISVVPLVGSSPLLTQEYQLNESIRMFSDKLRGYPLFIYSPGFVDTLEDKNRIVSSAYMQPILDLWGHLDFAVLGIGRIQERGELRQFRCGGESMAEEIRRRPDVAVGDICARQFNIRGEFIDSDFNRKLIGITGDSLMKAKNVLAMAVGSSKVIPIIGALRTGCIHYFVTDENTATQVLQLLNSDELPEK